MTGSLKVDPWLRIHADDVERGTPATLVKGTTTYSGNASVAILTRPATVIDVARNDDGSIHSLRLIDEGDGPLAGQTMLLDFSAGAGQGKYERPASRLGWSCVVGERYIAPERRYIAVVGSRARWQEFKEATILRLPRSAVATFDSKVQDLESDTVWMHVHTGNVTFIRSTTFDDVIELPDLIPLDQAFVAMVRAQLRPKTPAHQPPGPPELVDQPDR